MTGVITDLEMALACLAVRGRPGCARGRGGVPGAGGDWCSVGVSTLEAARSAGGLRRGGSFFPGRCRCDESNRRGPGCGMDPMTRRATWWHKKKKQCGRVGLSEVSVFCMGGNAGVAGRAGSRCEMNLGCYHHLLKISGAPPHLLVQGQKLGTAEEVNPAGSALRIRFVVVQGAMCGHRLASPMN